MEISKLLSQTKTFPRFPPPTNFVDRQNILKSHSVGQSGPWPNPGHNPLHDHDPFGGVMYLGWSIYGRRSGKILI